MPKLRNLLYLIIACSILWNCSSESEQDHNPIREKEPYIIGAKKVFLEIANNDSLRSLGLMHRKALEEDHGMLFVFESPSPRSFWMKNTYIPLDIAYISPSGVILEIHQMKPLDTSSTSSRSSNILMALEMNHGWFEKNQIKPGEKLVKLHTQP